LLFVGVVLLLFVGCVVGAVSLVFTFSSSLCPRARTPKRPNVHVRIRNSGRDSWASSWDPCSVCFWRRHIGNIITPAAPLFTWRICNLQGRWGMQCKDNDDEDNDDDKDN